jgi:preprotein translocase subunit SecA
MVGKYLFTEGQEAVFDVEGLGVYLKTKFNYDLGDDKAKLADMPREQIEDLFFDNVKKIYDAKEQEISPDHLRYLERMFLLHTIDPKWKDHLYAMDQLKEGIGLRSFAQRDPLVEYKREGFEMFQSMYESIDWDVAEMIFKIQPTPTPGRVRGVFSSLPQNLVHQEVSGLSEASRRKTESSSGNMTAMGAGASASSPLPPSSPPPLRNSGPKVGRNDPCPCGSGKKYKKCCG